MMNPTTKFLIPGESKHRSKGRQNYTMSLLPWEDFPSFQYNSI